MDFFQKNYEKIKYENDDEYRAVLCKLFTKNGIFSVYEKKQKNSFSFIENKIEKVETLETNEEEDLYFDEMLILKNMEYLFIQTKENILFQNLYDLAAAKMISTDRTIGQCVLFSYDYLPYFYNCLLLFIYSPQDFTEHCLDYKTLVEIIQQK